MSSSGLLALVAAGIGGYFVAKKMGYIGGEDTAAIQAKKVAKSPLNKKTTQPLYIIPPVFAVPRNTTNYDINMNSPAFPQPSVGVGGVPLLDNPVLPPYISDSTPTPTPGTNNQIATNAALRDSLVDRINVARGSPEGSTGGSTDSSTGDSATDANNQVATNAALRDSLVDRINAAKGV